MGKMPCHISDGPQLPEDVPGYVEIDEDAAYEEQRQYEIDTTDPCPHCKGHGADPLSDNVNWLPCQTCRGEGRIPKRRKP